MTPGTDIHLTRCTLSIERLLLKEAANRACGVEMVPDLNNPIYKECRHYSHGYEN